MIVTIGNKIEKVINNPRQLRIKYGKLAEKIEAVLSILNVADCLADVPNVPPTRRHKLVGNYSGCWALDLNKSYRLIIRPIGSHSDVESIVAVEIVSIEDYH